MVPLFPLPHRPLPDLLPSSLCFWVQQALPYETMGESYFAGPWKGNTITSPVDIDCHLHTLFSGHGEGTVAQVVERARALGLSTIALTEHLNMPTGVDVGNAYSMSDEGEAAYIAQVREQQAAHDDIEIVLGAEADWLGDPDFISARASSYDYLLGSVHFVDGWAFDDPANLAQWAYHDADGVWRRYVDIWCEAATSDVPFDTMSHPDLPKKFGFLPSFDLAPFYARMADAAQSAGRAVEVNTSGFHKPVKEQYPSVELLRAFQRAGVPCTVGSDSHSPDGVFSDIPAARSAMWEAGYRQIMVPTGHHERRLVSLEEDVCQRI